MEETDNGTFIKNFENLDIDVHMLITENLIKLMIMMLQQKSMLMINLKLLNF